MFLGGYEGATDVTYLLSLGSHFLAEIDGGFLRGGELIHLDSWQITVNHIYGHIGPPCGRDPKLSPQAGRFQRCTRVAPGSTGVVEIRIIRAAIDIYDEIVQLRLSGSSG